MEPKWVYGPCPNIQRHGNQQQPNCGGFISGHSMSYTIDVFAWKVVCATVALSVSGLSQGVIASFSPTVITTTSMGTASERVNHSSCFSYLQSLGSEFLIFL